MGLPLFVAPVESDLPSKSAAKHGVTSPPRSSIRRTGWRDARAANARRGLRVYGTVHHHSLPVGPDTQPDSSDRERMTHPPRAGVRMYAPAHRDLLSATGPDLAAPWGDAPLPPGFVPLEANEPIPSPFREALANVTQTSDRRRERLQELLHASLRSAARTTQDYERPSDYLGWFSVEPEGLATNVPRRSHVPRTMRPHFVATNDGPRPSSEAATQSTVTRESVSGLDDEQSRLLPATRRAMRMQARALRNQMTRRGQPPRRGVDGLGDRDRSLSPEVWDTLLSTLTPDPQPPSAGSSFASAAVSQTAAPSSTNTAPTADTETLPDGPCDSGCENSDGEDGDNRGEAREGSRRRPTFDEVELFNLDRPSRSHRSRRRDNRRDSALRSVRPDGPQEPPRQTSGDGTTGRTSGAIPISGLLHPAPQDGWVGRLSVGASDEEQGEDATQQEREGSAGNNASGGDEDLSGMQRIIRSLSWRQDIPEEWWAEAGLRRTLPSDTELA